MGLPMLIFKWMIFYIQVGGFQRVEIGDNSTWENCTFRVIQPVTLWTDTEIQFNFNKGGLQSGNTYYLFFVDEENQSYAGLPVTLP